jgi:Spy/CpxP family protein refolding chaperone
VAGLVVSAVVNLVAVFALGVCWRGPRGPEPAPPNVLDREQALAALKDRFGLTAAQMDTVEALHKYRRDLVKPVRDRLETLQAEMLRQLQAPELDRARTDSLLLDITATQDSLEVLSLGVLLRLRNVLTPEQRQRLPELFRDLQRAGRKPKQDRGPKPFSRQRRNNGR